MSSTISHKTWAYHNNAGGQLSFATSVICRCLFFVLIFCSFFIDGNFFLEISLEFIFFFQQFLRKNGHYSSNEGGKFLVFVNGFLYIFVNSVNFKFPSLENFGIS